MLSSDIWKKVALFRRYVTARVLVLASRYNTPSVDFEHLYTPRGVSVEPARCQRVGSTKDTVRTQRKSDRSHHCQAACQSTSQQLARSSPWERSSSNGSVIARFQVATTGENVFRPTLARAQRPQGRRRNPGSAWVYRVPQRVTAGRKAPLCSHVALLAALWP